MSNKAITRQLARIQLRREAETFAPGGPWRQRGTGMVQPLHKRQEPRQGARRDRRERQ